MIRRISYFVIVILFVLSPAYSYAFPFGGMAGLVHFCFNQAIYVVLGPPIGGAYIWTPATRTYQFGVPTHAGQWLLGLSGPPYYCLYSVEPVDLRPGIGIMMQGSSGPSSPVVSPPPSNTPPPTVPPVGSGTNPYDSYCKTRTSEELPPGWPTPIVEPCDQITQYMSCAEVKAQGYKFIHRCGT